MTHDEPAGLPDLRARQREASRPAVLPEPEAEPPSRRSRNVLIGAVTTVAVVLTALGLVLSQLGIDPTRPLAGPSASPATFAPRAVDAEEYIPGGGRPSTAPPGPPPLFTEPPSGSCTILEQGSYQPQPRGKVRGGALEFTIPRWWEPGWQHGDMANVDDITGASRHVELEWYSTAQIGRITWPAADGPYPGHQKAAESQFQCYATSGRMQEWIGRHPEVRDHRSEPTTIDGHPAWIVQATYHFTNSRMKLTHSSIITSIVVDTPGGPSVFISDVAADIPVDVRALTSILSTLRVTR